MKTLNSRSTRHTYCEPLENRRLLSFTPAVNYGTIGTPSAIVTADLNNDGKLDLVTCANAVTGSYSVFLGNGAGGFGAAQRTVMGTQLSSLAVADFNNDNKADLVVSDGYYGFEFLAGKGDGTFQPPVYTQSGEVAAVGRFNGDNFTDVLIARLGPDWEIQFQVYSGNGQGGFTAVEPELWYYGSGMTAVDLNNDGKLDVVTAEGYVFPGNGDGTFEFDWEQPALLDGGAIATGDFTGDGKADAIVAGYNKVSVLRGRGDGTFDAPITQAVAGNPHSGVATADFNGDGKLDAIVSTYDTGTVRLMLGNGDGTLRDGGTFATGTEPSGVVAGDFNRDGRPDVAVSNAGTSRYVSVLLNDGVWAGIKTFIGAGGAGSGGNWSNANNWSPAGVPAATDQVSVADKSVNLGGSATVASLTLTGGATLTVNANGNRLLRTSSLSISPNSKLNLNDNDLMIDYAGGAADSPIGSWNGSAYTGVTGMIARGYNFSAWDGNGLVTATFNARNGLTTLAPAEAADVLGITGNQTALWNGQIVDATTVIVKYTYTGDLNLDGLIDAADYGVIDNYFQFPGTTGYANGDFNYDGIIDAADYGYIDNSFQTQGPPL